MRKFSRYLLLPICVFALAAPRPAEANAAGDVHFKKGLQLAAKKQWPQAEAEYRKAIALDPGNATYRNYLADALSAQGKFQQGKSTAAAAAKVAPKPTVKKPVTNKPINAAPTKKPVTGQTAVPRKPVVKDGDAEFAWPETPRDDGSRGEAQEGDEAKLKPIPGDQPRVITRGGKTIIIVPRGGTGMVNNRPGDENPIELVPEGEEPGDDPPSQHYRDGTDFALHEKWPQAEAAFKAAIKEDPKSPMNWQALGDAYAEQKKWSQAEKAHREAVRLSPKMGYYRAQLAGDLLRMGRKDEARQEAQRSLDLGGSDHWVFEELGMDG